MENEQNDHDEETTENNVVNIFLDKPIKLKKKSETKTSLEEIEERNAKIAERVARERANNNKNVLRSYRIK